MHSFLLTLRKIAFLFRRAQADSELQEEMTSHREHIASELMEKGLTPDAARIAANRQFGNATLLKEQSHLVMSFRAETVMQDFRFALRQLQKNSGFAATAILILALGIGASVAIFGFVDAALLEPLPYANPARLMSVNESNLESPRWPLSYPDYLDWQRSNKSFSSLDIYSGTGFLMRTPSGTEPVQAERVSGTFFETLGVRPLLGRDFYPGENRPDGANVLLLSYGTWLHRFGARQDAVGKSVDLDGRAFTIIGVLPRTFSFAPGGNAEFWVPLNSLSQHEKMRTFYNFFGVGRLRDGVSMQAALDEMIAISKQLQRQYGLPGRNLAANIVPLSEIIIGDVRPILITLLGGANLLLLIACFNVASLTMIHSESRRREIAIRGALGATRSRLMRQFMTEGLSLAIFSSATGLLIAAGIMRLLAQLVPKAMASSMPFLGNVGLNANTGEFAAAVAAIAILVLTATPTLRFSFEDVADGLSDGTHGGGSRLWRKVGANLVVVELAIAVVLLTGAGLLGQSLYRLLHVPLGFDPRHLATVRVMASGSRDDLNAVVSLNREIIRRTKGLPGVESVGLASVLPVQCKCQIDRIHFPGRPDNGEHNDVDERHVSAQYFATLKATPIRGRYFSDEEDASRPGVTVINQALAQKYFPGENPVGQRISDDEDGKPAIREIVGVIDNVHEGPLDSVSSPAEYFPINQTLDSEFSLVVRTKQDASALLPLLVRSLHEIDPALGISNEQTMTEQIAGTQAALLHRSAAWIVGGFAAIALLLGVVGLYSVIAYSVSQRTREIGVRMALGAPRRSVYRLILTEAGWLTGLGIALGLVCAVAAATLMRSLLFGLHAWDISTLASVAAALACAALLASFIPAQRAASVNPIEALRSE